MPMRFSEDFRGRMLNGSSRVDEFGKYWSPNVAFAVSTLNFDNMATLVANTGGGVQTLPATYLVGGRRRGFISSLVLATQAIATTFGVARIFLPFVMTDITLVT